ncbi:MAG: putative peptidoglycan glycosyltransferase FtsW [Planctomycetota bacterium]
MDRSFSLIAVAAIALLGFGVVMVASAGISVVPATAEEPVAASPTLTPAAIFSGRTAAYAGLAILAMVAAACLPIRSILRLVGAGGVRPTADPTGDPSADPTDDTRARVSGRTTLIVLLVGACALATPMLLVYTPLGHEANASRRWLALGPITFQPSEIAKWGLIALIAWYVARRTLERGAPLDRFFKDLAPIAAAVGLVVLVTMKEDLGTAALVALVAGVVLIAAGMRWLHVLLTLPTALAAIAVGVLLEPYRLKRISSFLHPFEDPAGAGYHMIQSMAAVAGGEVTGRGLGHGLRKFGYLPEDTTDFVFAIICEELGVFGPALVILLYAVLLGAAANVARRERSPLLKLFTLGVVATIGFQASINVAVVTGLAPTKGIALPLISHGGTGWILTAASLGLVIAAARTQPRLLDNTLDEHGPEPDALKSSRGPATA